MPIPRPTAERLAQLYRILTRRDTREPTVTSSELENLTGWPSHTIRKDISTLSAGHDISTTNGYDTGRLASAIETALGLAGNSYPCALVGLGRLGSAFLDYPGFEGTAYRIAAGFDSNVNRIEILRASFPLYPAFKMKEVIPRLGIGHAILCVSEQTAQEAAARLIDSGVRAIVNFTPAILSVPGGIEVENVSILDALGTLTARLAVQKGEAT